tara:strand:+ start:65 stop:724 length:660 start_codon:yes stop_codon:yes gene_type:complete
MKKLFYVLILAPLLLAGQGPSFTVTDQNGNIWDSDSLLAEGKTIIIEFFSPSMTCWPSSNAIANIADAYRKMNSCNDLFFLQVAQWGYNWEVEAFLEEFGDTSIPWIPGYNLWNPEISGYDLTGEFVEYGLQWAYECWVLRPDGSYEIDLEGMSSDTNNYLIDFLEDEGFTNCDNSISIEEYQTENLDKNIYDITGRILPNVPSHGTYIQDGKKYHKIK